MYKLRNFDPATTDVDRLRIAVRVPEDIGIQAGGFRFILGSEHSEREHLRGEFQLERTEEAQLHSNIGRTGSNFHVFRIADRDVVRFNRLRQKILIEKQHGADGTLQVKADVCRTTPDLPSRILISTFVSASETNGFVALLRNVDALDGAGRKAALEMSPVCESL